MSRVRSFRAGFTAVLIAAIVTAFAQQGLPLVANAFRDADHLTLAALGGLVTAVAAGTLGGMVLWGRLIDRWGTWRTLKVSLMVTMIPLTVLVVMPSQPYLLLLVCLATLGWGLPGLPLTGMRWTAGAVSPGHQGIAISTRQAATPLGALVAALILTPLVGRWPLRGLLLVVILSLVVAGSILSTVLRPVAEHRSSYTQVVRPPSLNLRSLGSVFLVAILVGPGPYLVLTYGIATQRSGRLEVTAWLILVELGAVAGRLVAGWWSDRSGRITQVLCGTTALGALTLAALAQGMGVHGPVLVVAGEALCLGVGISAWNGLVYAWGSMRVAAAQQGAALGGIGAATFLGVAVASPVFGWIAQRWGVGTGWAVAAGAFALASLVAGTAEAQNVSSAMD